MDHNEEYYASVFAPLRHPVPPRQEEINSVVESFDSDAHREVISIHDSDSNNDNDNESICSDDSNEWNYPPPQTVYDTINNLPETDPNKVAWLSLLQHESTNSKASPDWYPWRNELCVLLFLCRFDATYGITRNIIQCFLNILLTLKERGHINNEYFIPTDASTIEKWWDFIPKPPIRMFKL